MALPAFARGIFRGGEVIDLASLLELEASLRSATEPALPDRAHPIVLADADDSPKEGGTVHGRAEAVIPTEDTSHGFTSKATAGLEGPIEELYSYAEQQEDYLLDFGSYSARLRQVRESMRMGHTLSDWRTSISHESLVEKTVLGGNRYIERSTELRLEVRVTLGALPDGRPIPRVWQHIVYAPVDDPDEPYRVYSSTRSELLDITIGDVEPEDVTFLAFGLPDDTLALVRYGDTNVIVTARLMGSVIVEDTG